MSSLKQRNPRYYLRGEVVNFEEDQTHEFKGHRNISISEIPPWCVNTQENTRTRNAACRNLCGFLNTGVGGTLYIGILDGGKVEGVRLTQYQLDHLLLSVQDSFSNFSPTVPRFLYNIELIPVLDPDDEYPIHLIYTPRDLKSNVLGQIPVRWSYHLATTLDIAQGRAFLDLESAGRKVFAEDNTGQYTHPASSLRCSEEVRSEPHYLRSHVFCWCDYDSLGQFHNGIIPMSFVVEITIPPIDCNDPRVRALMPGSKIPTRPVFQCEDGQVYFRKHACIVKYSMTDIAEQAKEEVSIHKMPELMKAWKQWKTASRLLELFKKTLSQQDKVENTTLVVEKSPSNEETEVLSKPSVGS